MRDQWGSRLGFILAAVGSAIGLGNIWRFPYQAYANGGGAFLIPYFIALLTAGIPLIILEFGVGHKMKCAAPSAYAKLTAKSKYVNNWEWLGWFQTFLAGIISTYYTVIVGWALSYTVFSFKQSWTDNPAEFFTQTYTKMEGVTALTPSLPISYIVLAVAIAWAICFIILYSGVKKGIEAANKVFIPMLIVMLLIILFKSISLEGAKEGLNFLFTPDFQKLKDLNVWKAAYGQIFFSLSVGFAVMISYSSYLPKKSDLVNNGFITGFLDCGFSMVSGIMIFSILGNMAMQKGLPIDEVVSQGVGLAFMTIPEAINQLPLPWLFGSLFFLSLTIAGISSAISIMEVFVISFQDKFGWERRKIVSVMVSIGFLISIMYTSKAGILRLDIVDSFINNFGIIFAALIEVIFLTWFFKIDIFKNHVNAISDFRVGRVWEYSLKILVPLILMLALNASILEQMSIKSEQRLENLIFGWTVIIGILIFSMILQSTKGKKPLVLDTKAVSKNAKGESNES